MAFRTSQPRAPIGCPLIWFVGCKPMRESLPFNLSLYRCHIGELRLSIGTLPKETHVTRCQRTLLFLV